MTTSDAPPAAPSQLVAATGALGAAPLPAIAPRLRDAIGIGVSHTALVVFTEDCTGRPQKKAGDERITERVTIVEMDAVRRALAAGARIDRATIGGVERPVWARTAETGAVLVLCDPRPTGRIAAGELDAFTVSLWHIAAARIRELVTDAGPAYLQDSRAVSSERVRVTAELTEQHATALESMLAVLRSRALDDRRARTSTVELATAALVRARTAGDLSVSIAEEPVVGAFARLRADLRPLTRYGRLDVQFVEPPVDGRALPGEVAHAARAIVRGLVLSMNEQAGVGRVRVQWDCDGTNLLINMRDDGPGDVDADVPGVRQARSRVDALGGTLTLTGVEGWGTELAVRLPLDAPRAATEPELDLAPREHEVLRLIARGMRNRQVALELGISENTVKFHVTAIYRKLGVSTRAAAAAIAVGAGYA